MHQFATDLLPIGICLWANLKIHDNGKWIFKKKSVFGLKSLMDSLLK